MKRNIEKMIEEYRHKTQNSRRGDFTSADLQRIKELAEEAAGPDARPGSVLFEAVTRALAVGFMAGYRVRKAEEQDSRKRQAERRKQ